MSQATSQFRFWPFVLVMLLVLGLIGALNYLIDPLWYGRGNQLTGKNFAFNERIAKVNLLQHTVAEAGYDCLILGSSRVTALRPSRFTGQRCFNLSLKGAQIQEFLAYARFARDAGLNPKTVYISVDEFNFVDNKETERSAKPSVNGSANAFHAYLSADVLVFSLMTLAGVSPDTDVYYDSRFEAQEFPGADYALPELIDKPDLQCNLGKVAEYARLREVFPQARLVGYAPPVTPWYKLSDIYSRRVLDCGMEAFEQIAASYDEFWDFSIPSALTEAPDVSYDGSHFSPAANDLVAAQLIGERRDLALDVKALGGGSYRLKVHEQLKAFLEKHQRADFWKD